MLAKSPVALNEVQHFVVQNVADCAADLVTFTSRHFGILRQAAHRHVRPALEEPCTPRDFRGAPDDREGEASSPGAHVMAPGLPIRCGSLVPKQGLEP